MAKYHCPVHWWHASFNAPGKCQVIVFYCPHCGRKRGAEQITHTESTEFICKTCKKAVNSRLCGRQLAKIRTTLRRLQKRKRVKIKR